MIFNYKSLNGNNKSIELPIDQNVFNEFKEKVEGSALEDWGEWLFWDLRDYLFSTLICSGFKTELSAFFEKLHVDWFKEDLNGTKAEVVDVCYIFYSGDSTYIFSEPSSVLYPNNHAERLELNLNYDVEELDCILEQLLDAFGVNYSVWTEDEESLSLDELDLGDIFGDLFFECWLQTKKKLNSNLIGLLSYATGGAGCIDLDNGNKIDETDEGILKYVEQRGIDVGEVT